MNGYYNNYQVRDAWWETKVGPLTLYTGNQIAVWGQSLAFRVGDVVNPTDTCWAFGFANLEQSRVPQWMVHPILNLPEYGPFQSNFLEGICSRVGPPTIGRNRPMIPMASTLVRVQRRGARCPACRRQVMDRARASTSTTLISLFSV